MEISAALASDLASLSQALDDPESDLETQLRRLVADIQHAIASYLGLRLTITLRGAEVTLTARERTWSTTDAATSLRLPLAAISPAQPGSNLVLYARTPGAFVDLAADLSYALALGPATLSLDDDLSDPVSESGIAGLDGQATINQALGVLIERGHTPESAREELSRLADLDGGHLHRAAESIIHSSTYGNRPSEIEPDSGSPQADD